MKILHAAETIKGGVATIIRQLVAAQVGQHKVLAYIPGSHAAELPNVPTGNLHSFVRTGRNIPSFLKFMFGFAQLVLREKPDIVHIHSTFAGFLCRPILFLLRPFAKTRVVYSPHAWSFLMDIPATHKRIYGVIEVILALFTHAIICGSKYEQQQAIAYGLPAKKLHFILSGVDVPPTKTTKAPTGLKADALNLLFVGRFDYQKGFDILHAAMQSLIGKPIHLTAVGEAVRGATTPAAAKNISYVGWLKPEELATYFAHADVLVMPSRWESFGLVAAEAAAYGLPVVASRSCSLPEVVLDGKTGLLFTPESVEELVDILASTPAKTWQSMRKPAAEHYKANLTAKRMTEQTTALYKGLRK